MTLFIVIVMLTLVGNGAWAQSCPKSVGTKTFDKCKYFALLESRLWWTYHPDKGSIDLAFRAKPPAVGGWVGWGINPTTTGMVGTQAVIAFQQSNGSMVAMTYNVTAPTAGPLLPSALSYPATNLSSTIEDGTIILFATIVLPSNKTEVSHTWQVGREVKGVEPQQHPLGPANYKSFGPIDLVSGATAPAGPIGAAPSPISTTTTPPSPPAPPTSLTPSPNHAVHNNLDILLFFFPLVFSLYVSLLT